MAQCPCGSGSGLDRCCGPFISGEALAPTAEALMRSRFTAFSQENWGHIKRTYASEARDRFDEPLAGAPASSVEWVGLDIHGRSKGAENDDTGIVEFAARFRKDGVLGTHREKSNFRRENGQWVYVDGEVSLEPAPTGPGKTGRNDPCPCGSGMKFKKCCGR